MNILVTGGAGFIGSNFIRYMLKKYSNYKLVNLDALTYAGNLDSLKDIECNNNYKFIHGNITDKPFVEKVFEEEKIDVVIHFAAESHVDQSVNNPSLFVYTNVLGTQVLLDAAKKYGIRRYHQISTDEVYGDLPLDRADLFFTEQTPLNPSSPYSASKAAADLLVQAYYRTFGMTVTLSRCSNNYGPYHFPEKLIPLVILKALHNETIPIYGDGMNIRDWLYVEDHCRAIDTILHNGKEGEIYNIGGHNERTNLEVVKAILDVLHKPESLIHYVKDRPGHDLRYAICPDKIEKQLGWQAKYHFEEGLSQTVQWYLKNEAWWKKILSGEYMAEYMRRYQDK